MIYRSLGLFTKSAKFSILAVIIPIRKKLKISLLAKPSIIFLSLPSTNHILTLNPIIQYGLAIHKLELSFSFTKGIFSYIQNLF